MKRGLCILPWARGLVAWLLGLVWLGAQAAPTCTFSSFSMSPTAPSRIVVTASVPAGKIIFSTVISANFSCSGGVDGDVFLLTSQSIGNEYVVSGVTNVSVTSNVTQSPPGATYGFTSGVTGPCSQTGTRPASRPIMIFNGSGTCSGRVSLGLTFFATSTGAVSGTIPAALSGAMASVGDGWLLAVTCSGPKCAFQSGLLGSINGPSIPITTLSSTCTLATPADQTVVLPTVGRSAFKGVGSTAAGTPLTIRYTCSTGGGAMSLSMAWMFDVDSQDATGVSVISNTGTATGVGVQIVDSANRAIISGAQTRQINSVSSGSNTISYRVRYYQTAATVTAGTVNAVAYYTATYN